MDEFVVDGYVIAKVVLLAILCFGAYSIIGGPLKALDELTKERAQLPTSQDYSSTALELDSYIGFVKGFIIGLATIFIVLGGLIIIFPKPQEHPQPQPIPH
jgi:hypothetical protein